MTLQYRYIRPAPKASPKFSSSQVNRRRPHRTHPIPSPELIQWVINNTIAADTLRKIHQQITKPLELLVLPKSVKRPHVIPRPVNVFVVYRNDVSIKHCDFVFVAND